MKSRLFSFGYGAPTGYTKGVSIKDGALSMSENGVWISEAIDSGESGTIWDKAEISFDILGNGFFRFTAVVSDSDSVSLGAESYPVEMVLRAVCDGARASFENLSAVSFINPSIVPLHTLKGRFLWFFAEGFPEKKGSVRISRIKVRCPHISLINALPEVFFKDDDGTLTSLLAVYKNVFDRLDGEITGFGERLDPDSASGEDLKRLVSWQGIRVSDIWGEDKLRKVVKASARLIRMKGTRSAVSEIFEILLGEKPEITEDTEGFSFTVTVDYNSVPSGRHHFELLSLLRDFTPVGITSRMVLKNNSGITGKALDEGLSLTDDTFGSGFII